MSESKRNNELNNGWILCPSKSFPGKFYYFNVLTGETAWSLNQTENKEPKKENNSQKITDKSHSYPEPTTLPDETTSTSHNIFSNTKKINFLPSTPSTNILPTFGQATFPKYVANVEPLIPNIVWTSVPFPMFCPETRKPMFDKVTQISEFERELFAQSSNIPLSKRFTNYEKPFLSFDRRNKIIKPSKFETSTPKNSFLECVPEPQNLFSNPFIKEPVFKVPKLLTPKIPENTKSNEKPSQVLSLSGKVESTKCSTGVQVDENENALERLDSTDLRFLLLAKRKNHGAAEIEVERKKPKAGGVNTLGLKKKVTFNIKDETDGDSSTTNDEAQNNFIPFTPKPTWTRIEAPKSPRILNDKIPPSFTKQNFETPKTPLSQLPTFQPNVTKHLPTFEPSVTKQQPMFKPSATNQLPIFQPPAINQATVTNQQPTIKSTSWYIVVDTDVLLLDYEFIEKLVVSDPKCRLVIPHVVATDIEGLCLGDCRGQQRVINARQLTRKLAAPPPYYIVERRTSENGNLVTESILQCCMKAANKNYYVVLITNDPHLQIRATLLNIPSYKLNDIKYGRNISPNNNLAQQKNTKITNALNTTKDMKNMVDQNINLFSNIKIASGIKTEEKSSNFDYGYGKKQCKINYRSPRKQLFLSSESETEGSAESDNLVTKKPICMEDIENGPKYDSDGTSEISSVVSSLQLKEKNVSKPQNVSTDLFPEEVGKNPFLVQNGFGNFEKRILNPNAVFYQYTFATESNENATKQRKNEINNFHNDFLDYNFEDENTPFSCEPITNMELSEPKSKVISFIRPDPYKEPKVRNSSQMRIEKLMNSINPDSTQLENQKIKPKDTAPVFKIPKLLPIKGAKNRSARVEGSPQNNKIVMRLTKDAIEQTVKRFRIKNEYMRAKVSTRIDEWICSFMQIMEDVLVNILQQNSVCMKNTVAPLTFKDTLNCVKMLYDDHTRVRDVSNRLSEWLEKCMIGVQGQFKIAVAPEDFMRIFGYGVLLVQVLKDILPLNEDLKEAKIRLNVLHMNLKSNSKEIDPELVKSPSVSRIDNDEEEIRPQFFKKTSFVIDYLKKHFKEWEGYTEDLDEQNHKMENHADFKVVRTLGKNLSLLKIDKRKNMSLSNITRDDDVLDKENEPKIIRMLENNQLTKPNNTENIETNDTKLMRLVNNENKLKDFRSEDNLNKEKNVQLSKYTENLNKDQNFGSKGEEFNYTTHENTFLDKNTGKAEDEPKIVRNIKLIDKFEDKLKTREPLDLDLLDYSDIYEPSIKDIDFDVISEKNYKIEEKDIFDIGLNSTATPVFTLEDFYITPSISPESVKSCKNTKTTENGNTINDNQNSEKITSSYFSSVSENNNVTSSNIEEKIDKNNSEQESMTYTEKGSNNDSCIGNENSEKHFGVSEKHVGNSEKHFGNSETPIYDSGTNHDISESHNDNFGMTIQIVFEDSTNDSGFENDSTYAHLVVKMFLKEISTTFQVIHEFVTKFVEEIREAELSEKRKDSVHNMASKALENMVAIINHLKWIIKRESAEETVLKTLLRNAGVEATTDRRIMRYRQIVIKCLEQALILESALKIIVSTTIGDFDAISANAANIDTNMRYFNIFEPGYQPFVGHTQN